MGVTESHVQNKEESKLVTTTVRDYDLAETSKLVRAVYMGCAMMAFMHLYMKYVFSPSLPRGCFAFGL